MRGRASMAALVAGGALALHELRYVVVYHHDAGTALALDGHGYLSLVTPLAAALMALSLAPVLRRWAGAQRVAGSPGWSAGRLWAALSACLLAVYMAQEWLEGVLLEAHPAGLEGVFGHGGWSAVLLAAALGGLVALAVRGSKLAPPAAAAALPRASVPRPLLVALPLAPERAAPDAVACFLAGRGPPHGLR